MAKTPLEMPRGTPATGKENALAFAGTPASLAANALAFAGTPASLVAYALAFAVLPQIKKRTFWCLRDSRRHFQRRFGHRAASVETLCGPYSYVELTLTKREASAEAGRLGQAPGSLPCFGRGLDCFCPLSPCQNKKRSSMTGAIPHSIFRIAV